MARYTQRRLDVFKMHAHLRETPVDYSVFLDHLLSIPRNQRIGHIGSRVIAITDIEKLTSSAAELVFVEGDEESVPLVLDTATGTDRNIDLGSTEVVVTKTYAVVDFGRRTAVVMYNHRGAKADDVKILLQAQLRSHPRWEYLELEFVEAVDESFDAAIERFTRITSASATVTRPNFDWDDHAESLLDAAGESNAQTVDVEMHAGRGSTLSHDSGIVAFLKRQATNALPFLKDAVVRGYRDQEVAPTSVRMKKHVVHQRVRVPFDATGQIDEPSIRQSLRAYWEAIVGPEAPDGDTPDTGGT